MLPSCGKAVLSGLSSYSSGEPDLERYRMRPALLRSILASYIESPAAPLTRTNPACRCLLADKKDTPSQLACIINENNDLASTIHKDVLGTVTLPLVSTFT